MKEPTKPEGRRTTPRDAVETAIDEAKSDKSSTWETIGVRVARRISQWRERVQEAPVEPARISQPCPEK